MLERIKLFCIFVVICLAISCQVAHGLCYKLDIMDKNDNIVHVQICLPLSDTTDVRRAIERERLNVGFDAEVKKITPLDH